MENVWNIEEKFLKKNVVFNNNVIDCCKVIFYIEIELNNDYVFMEICIIL